MEALLVRAGVRSGDPRGDLGGVVALGGNEHGTAPGDLGDGERATRWLLPVPGGPETTATVSRWLHRIAWRCSRLRGNTDRIVSS